MENYQKYKKEQKHAATLQQRADIKKQKQIKKYSVWAAVIAVLCAAAITVTCIVSSSGITMRNKTALSCGDTQIDNAMMAYFFYSALNDYTASNGDELIDTSSSLKKQQYDEGVSWYDYILNTAKQDAEQVLVLCAEAENRGITLDESDISSIDNYFESLRQQAKNEGLSLDKFIAKSVCKGVNAEDVRRCTELSALAQKCYTAITSGITYTPEQLEQYKKENYNSLLYADYKVSSFNYIIPSDATEEEAQQLKDEAKQLAQGLAATTTVEEFDEYVSKYLKETKNISDASLTQILENTNVSEYAYEINYELGKWLFNTAEKTGDTVIIEGENQYSVYMITKMPYILTSPTKNVRQILFSVDYYGSAQEALNKANEVLSLWQSGEATEESFAALAAVYNQDPGSKSESGLYENVSEGVMVSEFNDWCFNSGRKAGDCEIVTTTYGAHIMYFISDGLMQWQATAKQALFNTDYDKIYSELEAAYPVTEGVFNFRDKK